MNRYLKNFLKYATAPIIVGVIAFAAVANGDTVCPPPPPPPPPITYNTATTSCASPGSPAGQNGYDSRYFIHQADMIKSFGITPSAHEHGGYGRVDWGSTTSAATFPINPAHLDDPGYVPVAFSNCKFYGFWDTWLFPTPRLNGVGLSAISPGPLYILWRSPTGAHVLSPPFGEGVLAGNPDAVDSSQNPNLIYTCGDPNGPTNVKPFDCTGVVNANGRPTGVTAQMTFQDCWDGQGASRPDPTKQFVFDAPYGIDLHHFSFSVNGACAAGSSLMAQPVTQQQFVKADGTLLVNPLNADGSMALSFSNGPYFKYHADWLNTTNHSLPDIVNTCLNGNGPAGHGCPDGTYIGTVHPTHQLG